MIGIVMGLIIAAVLIAAALVILARRHFIAPVDVERAAGGLELNVRRGALHDLIVTTDTGTVLRIDQLQPDVNLLSWNRLGFAGQTAPAVNRVTIIGRAGSRYFELTTSFGTTTGVTAEFDSTTWRYIDRPGDLPGDGENSERLTVAPEQP